MVSSPPLTFRHTGSTVHLVGTAAGPIGGDRLRLAIVVEDDAELDLRSVAATIALPGPGGEASALDVDIVVRRGGRFHWRPEPIVVVRGADHRVNVRARLDPDATLVVGDTVVLGRTGETGGSIVQRLDVEVGGAPRLRNEVRMGPCWPDAAGPAVTGGARVVAQVLAVGPSTCSAAVPLVDGVRGALMQLSGGGVLACILGADASSVVRAGDQVRVALDGSPGVPVSTDA
jgi:urease accessory protein